MACSGLCTRFDTVPRNYPKPKKLCRTCDYEVVTNNIRCDCCKNKYRVNRTRHTKKPTGNPIGRPKKIEVPFRVHPLFDW